PLTEHTPVIVDTRGRRALVEAIHILRAKRAAHLEEPATARASLSSKHMLQCRVAEFRHRSLLRRVLVRWSIVEQIAHPNMLLQSRCTSAACGGKTVATRWRSGVSTSARNTRMRSHET